MLQLAIPFWTTRDRASPSQAGANLKTTEVPTRILVCPPANEALRNDPFVAEAQTLLVLAAEKLETRLTRVPQLVSMIIDFRVSNHAGWNHPTQLRDVNWLGAGSKLHPYFEFVIRHNAETQLPEKKVTCDLHTFHAVPGTWPTITKGEHGEEIQGTEIFVDTTVDLILREVRKALQSEQGPLKVLASAISRARANISVSVDELE